MSSSDNSDIDNEEVRSEESDNNSNDSDEEANKSNKSENEEGSSSNANKSENEDNEDNEEANDKILKKASKFEETKLVLTSEIKIDVGGMSTFKENTFLTGYDTKQVSKPNNRTALKLLNEINEDLNDLTVNVSKIFIKSRENSIILQKKNSPDRLNRGKNSIEDEYRSGQSDDERFYPHNEKKVYSDKEVNTNIGEVYSHNLNLRDSYNHNIKDSNDYFINNKSPNYNHYNKNDNKQNIINVKNNKYTPTNPYNYKINNNYNNHIRTIEDLYNRPKNQPVIYNDNKNHQQNIKLKNINKQQTVNKKYFEGEPETYENEYFRSKEKLNSMRNEKNKYKPKNINHAIDILLDK